jgi:hypothetical protein
VPPVLLVAADEVSNKRRSSLQRRMSAFGTKRTSLHCRKYEAFGAGGHDFQSQLI